MGALDEEGERCPCSSASRRQCLALASLQVLFTVLGLGLSAVPWFDDNSLCSQSHSLCLADLHRHSWWLTPPTSFWAGVAALCMLRGQRSSKAWSKSWWLSTSFDLQVMVAPVSALCFLLLGWQALWIRHVYFAGCARGAGSAHHADAMAHNGAAHIDGDAYGEGLLDAASAGHHHGGEAGCGAYPTRALYTYAGLSIVMQFQAACAVCAAFAVRGGRLESYPTSSASRGGSSGGGGSSSGRSKGGWRKRINAEGKTFYEHRRTGKVQWEQPTPSSSDVEEGRSDMSGCEGRLSRVDEA